ncbi:MAG: HEAT repeat domain-containing protein [Gemmatimonadaceae bacterium]
MRTIMTNIIMRDHACLTVVARRTLVAAALVAAMPAMATRLTAQETLAARIAAVQTGTVQFEFPSRDNACGDGHSFIRVGTSIMGSYNSDTDMSNCVPGPVRIVLDVAGGRVSVLRDYLGPVPPVQAGVTELGEVSADEGSKYLLSLAERDDQGRVANRAVLPAMLGRDVVAWPTLLRIAKTTNAARRGSRKHDVIFWLGQYAAAKVNGSDDPFYPRGSRDDENDEESVKEQAVFALSQLRNGEGVEPLIEAARSNKDQRVRARAMFWLGESGDPRALDLFEQVLTGRAPSPRG